MHGLNGLKYISTVVALVLRTTNEFHRGMVWQILAATSSSIATIVNTYWDIVIDWGLLRRNSRNPWLREKLSVPNKSVYFVAMVSYFLVASICILYFLCWLLLTIANMNDFLGVECYTATCMDWND